MTTYTEARVRENLERLEREVDASSLSSVLEVLAMVCEEKAEHIASNWQDRALAAHWAKAGRMIARLEATPTIRSL